jgi:hypothetical protein
MTTYLFRTDRYTDRGNGGKLGGPEEFSHGMMDLADEIRRHSKVEAIPTKNTLRLSQPQGVGGSYLKLRPSRRFAEIRASIVEFRFAKHSSPRGKFAHGQTRIFPIHGSFE